MNDYTVLVAVYFLREEGPGGLVKIGFTLGNPHDRLATLQTGNARQLTLLATIPGDHAMEQSLHRRFVHDRKRGERFQPSPELLSFIDGIVAGTGFTPQMAEDDEVTPDAEVLEELGITSKQLEELFWFVQMRQAITRAYLVVRSTDLSSIREALSALDRNLSMGSGAGTRAASRTMNESVRSLQQKLRKRMCELVEATASP